MTTQTVGRGSISIPASVVSPPRGPARLAHPRQPVGKQVLFRLVVIVEYPEGGRRDAVFPEDVLHEDLGPLPLRARAVGTANGEAGLREQVGEPRGGGGRG